MNIETRGLRGKRVGILAGDGFEYVELGNPENGACGRRSRGGGDLSAPRPDPPPRKLARKDALRLPAPAGETGREAYRSETRLDSQWPG
jgi:hypothetical protein